MAFQIPQVNTVLVESKTQIPFRESLINKKQTSSNSTIGAQKELPSTVDEVLENIERIGPVKMSVPLYKLNELKQIAVYLGIPRISNAKKEELSNRILAFVNEHKPKNRLP